MSVTPQNELVQNLQTLGGKVPSAMQVFSGIYLNFAGLAAVVEKTGFLQKLLTCFRKAVSRGWFVILAFLRADLQPAMTATCALPGPSGAALAAYGRGGVYGTAMALGLQSNSGLRLR